MTAKCEGCAAPNPNSAIVFNTRIGGETLEVRIEVRDASNCPLYLCAPCVRRELVYWMATTAPTDPLDDGPPGWDAADALAAKLDGWHFVRNAADAWDIYAVDDDETFKSDKEALDFVTRQAEAESDLHQRALDIHNRFNS